MARLVQRAVLGIVAVAAVCAFAAAHHNHTTKPCHGGQFGAGGMCVTYAAGGDR